MKVKDIIYKFKHKYQHFTVCDDIKPFIVTEGDTATTRYEVINPVEFTLDEFLKRYDLKTKVSKTLDTYAEDGKETMAIVLD